MSQTCILLDWDDTLFCSTFVASTGLKAADGALRAQYEAQFQGLEAVVIGILTLAKTFGDVYIVTNAEHGWVELSAKRFLPGVLPHLTSGNISVCSSRSLFEKEFPNAPYEWKLNTFHSLLARYGDNQPQVLSFGDSNVEREAVRTVTRELQHRSYKSIKFAERPSLEQLRRQLELVSACMKDLVAHNGELDLALTITTPADPPVEAN